MGNQQKQVPAYIQIAQQVLAQPDIQARDDFKALKKGLTVLAAKMHQSGEGVTFNDLKNIADQGAEYVRQRAESYQLEKKLTYAEIVESFPKPPKEIVDLDWVTAIKNGDLDILAKQVESGLHLDMGMIEKVEKRKIKTSTNKEQERIFITINNIEIDSMDILSQALRHNDLNLIKFFFEEIGGYSNDFIKTFLSSAASDGQIEIFNNLANKVENLANDGQTALCYAARHGHIKIVKHLIELGVDVDHRGCEPLRCAVERGDFETFKTLFKSSRNKDAAKKVVLIKSAQKGRLNIIKYLQAEGLDIAQYKDILSKHAALANHYSVVNHLHGDDADLDFLSPPKQKFYEIFVRWKNTAGSTPPKGCVYFPAELYRDQKVRDCLNVLSSALQVEVYDETQANEMAFQAAVLFGDDQTALRYLKKHGSSGKQPLHDVIYQLHFPKNIFDENDQVNPNIDWDAWRGAVMMHGPKMARLFKFADKVTPIRSSCGKNWLYNETLAEVAKHSYERAKENLELSTLFMSHVLDEEDFEDALDLIDKFNKANKKSCIPDISFTLPNGMTYKKLADGDIRGLVLGEITDCCQTINNHGDDCVRHGFLSKNGGFYVVLDKKGEIIGQSWAWLGRGNELVLDSLESLGERISKDQWEEIIKELSTKMPKNITALHVGTGGETPELNFEKISVKPKDYKGYRDSEKQYRVWKR